MRLTRALSLVRPRGQGSPADAPGGAPVGDEPGAGPEASAPVTPEPRDDPRDTVGIELARLTASGSEDRGERARQLRRLAVLLARSARGAGGRAVLGGRWVVDILLDTAPRLALRDRATLRQHHPGLSDEAIAQVLVTNAARATSVVGAAGGAAVAASWTVPPSLLLSAPVEIAAETLAVACIEVKLVGELHALHGVLPPGGSAQRAQAYVMSWANGRGIDPTDPKWMASSLGGAAKTQIRKRLMGRAARGTTTLAPLLTGAVAGAVVNGRSTRSLAERIDRDLRSRVWRP